MIVRCRNRNGSVIISRNQFCTRVRRQPGIVQASVRKPLSRSILTCTCTCTTHSGSTSHACKQSNCSRCHSHRRDSRRPCHDNCSERHIILPTYRPLAVFTPHPSSLAAAPLHNNHRPLSPLASSTEP